MIWYIWVVSRGDGLPTWCSSKESTCRCKRCRFDPWVRKNPWSKTSQPTSILPEKFHGQRSLHGVTESQTWLSDAACTSRGDSQPKTWAFSIRMDAQPVRMTVSHKWQCITPASASLMLSLIISASRPESGLWWFIGMQVLYELKCHSVLVPYEPPEKLGQGQWGGVDRN